MVWNTGCICTGKQLLPGMITAVVLKTISSSNFQRHHWIAMPTVFLTNAILCLKTNGGLQGDVKKEWFSNCGRAFLRPLIEIVQPKVAVCLGERAWRSVTAAFDQPAGRFRDSVENPRGVQIMDGGVAMAVYHCGARILNTHRNREQQFRDWHRIRKALGHRPPT